MCCSALFKSGTMLGIVYVNQCLTYIFPNAQITASICLFVFSPGIDSYQILVLQALLLSDHLQVLPIQQKIMQSNIYIMDEGKA